MSRTVAPSQYQGHSSYMSTKKDLVGIEWLPVGANTTGDYKNYSPTDPNTIYRPLGGPLAVAHDISREEFEVAAALDIEATGFFSDIATVPAPEFSPNNYDLVGSLSAEGYAKDADNDGYAESFFTDEVEVFLGLINENGTPENFADDKVVGAVEVEIDFKRKVDILLNGGADIKEVMASLSEAGLLSLIKGIDITYYGDTTDPLVACLAEIAVGIGEVIADAIPPQLASLIEIEAGDPHASDWAKSTFNALRTPAVFD